jgi:hypothetical protein
MPVSATTDPTGCSMSRCSRASSGSRISRPLALVAKANRQTASLLAKARGSAPLSRHKAGLISTICGRLLASNRDLQLRAIRLVIDTKKASRFGLIASGLTERFNHRVMLDRFDLTSDSLTKGGRCRRKRNSGAPPLLRLQARCSGMTMSERVRAARRITLRNSRTFPGHE